MKQWCTKFVALMVCISGISMGAEKPFVCVVPSYNNMRWYLHNLDSLVNQEYSNFRIIYIDDCSNDGMSQAITAYLARSPHADKIEYIRNTQRKGALANIITAVYECQPHEIVLLVDGDDWLVNNQVLKTLNAVYQDEGVWLTYGQYTRTSGPAYGCRALPEHVITANSYRTYDWVTSHLRTFYAGLFHQIELDDLRYGQGYYPMAWDLAMMFPMLEMAGRHSRFIPQVLYVYNTENPLNDFKQNLQLQQSIDRMIRSKKRYTPLAQPAWKAVNQTVHV